MPPCCFQIEREVMGQCAFLETGTTLLSQDLCVGTYTRLLGTCTAEQQMKNTAEVARSRILHRACTHVYGCMQNSNSVVYSGMCFEGLHYKNLVSIQSLN